VLNTDIGMFMAHVQMAHVYEQNGMWKDAATEARLAVAANPDDPSLLTDLGVLLRQADSLSESETVLRQSVDANPRDPRPPYYLGLTELQMGKADAARTAFQRFLAMAPSRDSAEIAEVQRYIIMLH
jgi:Tfp pilus assembly protein PilF